MFSDIMPKFCWPIDKWLLKKRFRYIGKNTTFYSQNSSFLNPENMVIGSAVFINSAFYCTIEQDLMIGDRVMFGSQVSIIGGDHKYNDPNNNMRFNTSLGENYSIKIESDAWIGHGTIILKKALISEGTIVGANSLVVNHLKPYCVYAGQPAKFIKPRFKSFHDLKTYLLMMEEKYNFSSNYNLEYLSHLYE